MDYFFSPPHQQPFHLGLHSTQPEEPPDAANVIANTPVRMLSSNNMIYNNTC
jgi:hypothetical protein